MASTITAEGGVGVDRRQHVAVRRRAARASVRLVDHRHAAGERAGGLDGDVAALRARTASGWVSASTAHGSCIGGAGDVVVAARCSVPREERRAGRRAPRPAGPAMARDALDALGRGQELVGHVETGHDQRAAVAEHDRRRLRVGPDVELGDRGAVAERAAAHDRDPGDATGEVGRRAQRERDVRQRADGDEPRALAGAARLDDEADGVGRRRAAGTAPGGRRRRGRWRRGRRPPCCGSASSGRAAPAVHRHVDAEQLAHDERVVRRALERGVAGDGRDAERARRGGRRRRWRWRRRGRGRSRGSIGAASVDGCVGSSCQTCSAPVVVEARRVAADPLAVAHRAPSRRRRSDSAPRPPAVGEQARGDRLLGRRRRGRASRCTPRSSPGRRRRSASASSRRGRASISSCGSSWRKPSAGGSVRVHAERVLGA